MTLKVFMRPDYSDGTADRAEGGIRRICEAMYQYLPEHGIRFVKELDKADLAVGHATERKRLPGQPFIACVHGLHWADYRWHNWAHEVNAEVVAGMVQAQAITVPSQWVGRAVTRGLLRRPTVIYHGVNADEWQPEVPHGGYVLWNKARSDPVSNPREMMKLAALMPDVQFQTTVGEDTPNVRVLGVQTLPNIKHAIQSAGVYLATARETFGIGTLEALASGVPVAGWDYGGQREIIVPGETGYLAPYGDYAALAESVRQCLVERERLSVAARADVLSRWTWPDKVERYAELFKAVVGGWTATRPKVTVVIPAYNLARWLPEAIESVLAQTLKDWECLIVDDSSTDNTADVAAAYGRRDPRITYLRTPKNSGLSATRNYGASQARGRYLQFLDADDTLPPEALELTARALDADPSLHIAFGSLALMQPDGSPPRVNAWPSAFEWRAQMAHINSIHTGAMQRREVWEELGGYRERCWRAEDADFWCRATSFGFRAAKVTEAPSLFYRMRGDSKGQTEYRTYADKDGPWTEWFPWNLGMTAQEGSHRLREGLGVANEHLVPSGAQGKPTINQGFAYNAYHHEHPAVSVVIPVGPGHSRHVVDALDSLIAQDVHAWEAVVVNDSGEAWDSVPGAPWARVVQSATSGGNSIARGPGAARNAGIQAARAPLVLLLDSDDWLTPGALRAMLEAYMRGDVAYIYGDYLELQEDGRTTKTVRLPEYDQYQWKAHHGIVILIAREHLDAVKGFDEELAGWEDWDLFAKLAVTGRCGKRVDGPTFLYRKHDGHRRDDSFNRKADLLPIFRERYAAYYDREKEMGNCCPGGGDAIMAAKRALEGPSGALVGNADAPKPVPTSDLRPKVQRMEFVGPQVGAITFFGANGRQYRGGNNPLERFCDMFAEDVDRLVATGLWQVVDLPLPKPEPVVVPLEEVMPAPDRSAVDVPLVETLMNPIAAEMLGTNGNGHHAEEDVPLVETLLEEPEPAKAKKARARGKSDKRAPRKKKVVEVVSE